MTRHLLYHVYPIKTCQTWRFNLDQLKARWPLFNGRRIIAVAYGPETVPPTEVVRYMGACEADYIMSRNVPQLREVETWLKLWPALGEVNNADAVFCAHAKGVTRPVDPGTSVHRWASLLYETCLDYWPIVEEILGRHPIAGALKKVGYGFEGSRSSWHYSGTFYWVRFGDARTRWREIDRVWWGTESWPGIHWTNDFAGAIFHQGGVPSLDMYNLGYLNGVVEPALRKWRELNKGKRRLFQ
jgi:hypothetical protein